MRLKELRKERKMLQRQVAKAINCSQAVYSRYENGEREPSKEILASLADLYGVSVDYLLGREDDSPRPGWIKITPNMAGEAGIIPEGAVRVGNVSRTFAESEEARQFKVVPEVTGNSGTGKSSMISGDWYPSAPPQPPLVLDGGPPRGIIEDRPETQIVAAEVMDEALNNGMTKEETLEFIRYYAQLFPEEKKYIMGSMKFLHSQHDEEERT